VQLKKLSRKELLQRETPQHHVVLTRPFWCGITEVSIGQFKKFVTATRYVTQHEQELRDNKKLEDQNSWRAPGYPVKDTSPVTYVTWNDAVAYCNWLSALENLPACYRRNAEGEWAPVAAAGYRLPTEAEWEYACRAGTTTMFPFGDDVSLVNRFAWFKGNSKGQSHPVGTLEPNAFGVQDMLGNVWEWCQDRYLGKYEAAAVTDPQGPEYGSARVLR